MKRHATIQEIQKVQRRRFKLTCDKCGNKIKMSAGSKGLIERIGVICPLCGTGLKPTEQADITATDELAKRKVWQDRQIVKGS